MKETLKSYLVFTSLGYRIWALIIIPLIFAGLAELLLGYDELAGAVTGICCCIVMIEIMTDYWLYGGICVKNTRSMEYLKTSVKGKVVLQKGLIMDLVRRFVYLFLFSLLCVLRSGNMEYFVTGMTSYLIVVIALNISRYLPSVQMQLGVSMCGMFLYLLLQIAFASAVRASSDKIQTIIIELIILGVAAIASSILTVWHAMYRVKGSYYEK